MPIGGKYRLIDVPVSRCLHADIRRIFVLTQFNSASLNRHINNTYRLDLFSGGFVEILAAEQTPDNPHWYQGTADAVRQAVRHITQHEADHYLILAGDHLYRMDYSELIWTHKDTGPTSHSRHSPPTRRPRRAWASSGSMPQANRRVRGEAERRPAGEIGRSIPSTATFASHRDEQPFMASMGIYVFKREVILELLEREPGHDFGRELIPTALSRTVSGRISIAGTGPMWGRSNPFMTRTSCWGAPLRHFASGSRPTPSTRTSAIFRARGSLTAPSATPSL